ncbi:MAG: glycerophosphodiester phosphodiesterase [Chloroflexi bacterium]|nr:glycerophosphodiester phosphodiesterase [Chloroflexota bacterium]
MLNNFTPPAFFAHRGACAHAPENTLSAFELAAKQGAPAIEFDVKLTSDRQVIIIHDQTLDRTTVGKKVFINVELTNYATPFDGLVREVAPLVKKHGLEKRIIFSSFLPTNLVIARRLLPETPRGQLMLEGNSGWWQRAAGTLMSIDAEHPYLTDVTAESVQRAHNKGRRVHAWTVNDPADMRRMRSLGVDAIFTDDPLIALEHFK